MRPRHGTVAADGCSIIVLWSRRLPLRTARLPTHKELSSAHANVDTYGSDMMLHAPGSSMVEMMPHTMITQSMDAWSFVQPHSKIVIMCKVVVQNIKAHRQRPGLIGRAIVYSSRQGCLNVDGPLQLCSMTCEKVSNTPRTTGRACDDERFLVGRDPAKTLTAQAAPSPAIHLLVKIVICRGSMWR
jgi:hypothetical protein